MTGYFQPAAAQKAARKPARAGWALRLGPSMVSLSALIWAAPALAQTTVTANTTTPLATSKAGDITINGGVSVKPASGAAVTVDSNNVVANNGLIQFQDIDNVVGVLVKGGFTGGVFNNGTIQVDETFNTPTNDSGIPHGPFAKGTGRYGIRLIGPGDFTGDIVNGATGGGISVKGNNSYGISLESNLTGQLTSVGTLSIIGDNTIGIRTTGKVGGTVTVGGNIAATGLNAQAVNLGGDIGGQVLINGSVASTGFSFTSRSTSTSFVKQLQADNLLLGGPTVTVGGSVAKGIVVDIASVDANGAALTSTGTISSISDKPALVVGGAAGHNITLGNVDATTAPYGLDIRGTVVGSGIYDGFSASAVQLGVTDGGAVDTSGGIHVSGTVGASSYAASATAMHLNGGVTAPVIRNDGSIVGSMSSDAQGATARGILIEAGANVQALVNSNSITATVAGQQADVAAVVDRSGTLSTVENTGTISAGRTFTDINQPVTGHNIAIDARANTTGVDISQSQVSGAALAPSINGSVSLGSGNDQVDIQAGTLNGDLDLGAGANALTIDGGASVRGALNAAGGTVALNVGTGTLQINNASQLKLSSLSLGPATSLIVTADPALGLATNLDVAGNATIASGAKIGVRFNSVLQGSTTFTIIRADHLTAGTIDSSLLGSVPFLYNSSLTTDTTAGTVDATLSLKSAAQLGLPGTTSGAYNAVIANIGRDKGLEGALLIQTDRSSLLNLYNQLLPNHSGSLFNLMSASVNSFGKPLDDRQDPVGGGFWFQETNLGVFSNGQPDDPGYKGWSIGGVGGYEVPRTPLGILGVTFGASTNQIYADNTDTAQNLHATLFDAGVYWRMTKGAFTANARVAGDYARVTSDRVIQVLGGEGLAINRTANGHWSAFGFDARAMASYEAHFGGHYYLRPQASLDYVRFAEGSYTETGGGDGMNLAVNSRTSSRLSAFAGVAVGALYGPDRSWGPEALVGYRAVASETLGDTTAKFVAGGDSFTLRSDDISGQGAVVHLSVKGENGSGGFSVGGGAEARDGLNIYDLRVAGHVQF